MSSPQSLRKRSEIDRVFKSGKRFRSPDITLICLPAPQDHLRVAISVKRGLGSVERNRVRRRLREALRSTENVQGGADGVLVAGKNIQILPFTELQRQMCQILEAAKLLKKG